MGTWKMQKSVMTMIRTARRTFWFRTTRCSREYNTRLCPVTMPHQPNEANAVLTCQGQLPTNHFSIIPREWLMIPHDAIKSDQKYRVFRRLKVDRTLRSTSADMYMARDNIAIKIDVRAVFSGRGPRSIPPFVPLGRSIMILGIRKNEWLF